MRVSLFWLAFYLFFSFFGIYLAKCSNKINIHYITTRVKDVLNVTSGKTWLGTTQNCIPQSEWFNEYRQSFYLINACCLAEILVRDLVLYPLFYHWKFLWVILALFRFNLLCIDSNLQLHFNSLSICNAHATHFEWRSVPELILEGLLYGSGIDYILEM